MKFREAIPMPPVLCQAETTAQAMCQYQQISDGEIERPRVHWQGILGLRVPQSTHKRGVSKVVS